MTILKILSDIDKAAQAIDKVSTLFDPKPAPSNKTVAIEEREKLIRERFLSINEMPESFRLLKRVHFSQVPFPKHPLFPRLDGGKRVGQYP